ncbi:RING finger protein [Aspergillus saccharolyticus JOP 1030-1]|uniref:RING-type domain-containing protein n=1 Tax=Aspergillus saccharolyticus JOP 1030-1 TaxID=1450539 RepID=A0A318ZJV3_9EURO|nr:hypothetical protein BP01DRAFT_392871 [Aspergillus saccharolyticus JOP 1030-1]PYH44050.1 hypothetical protein BP01DRAFT_392871 [Aspergillus saccharolyticus JOP 1030-1]
MPPKYGLVSAIRSQPLIQGDYGNLPPKQEELPLYLCVLYIIVLSVTVFMLVIVKRRYEADFTPRNPALEPILPYASRTCEERRVLFFQQNVVKDVYGDWWASVQTERSELLGYNHLAVCPICLEGVTRMQLIYLLPCRHVFHDRCLEGWVMSGRNTCPLCLEIMARPGRKELV